MRQCRACVVCNAQFEARKPTQTTCCNRCYMWNQRHPGCPDGPRICDICGQPFLSGTNRSRKHCESKVCQREALNASRRCRLGRRKLAEHDFCGHCGAEFEKPKRGKQFCSSRCWQRENRFPGSWPHFRDRRCERCDARVAIEKKREARFCTERCQNVANAENRRARGWGARVQPFSRIKVFDRDNWTCHICREPVDRDADWPHPRAATVDHIIPLAETGSPGHILSNVACAHTFCNYSKHDRTRYEDWVMHVALDATGSPPLVDALF